LCKAKYPDAAARAEDVADQSLLEHVTLLSGPSSNGFFPSPSPSSNASSPVPAFPRKHQVPHVVTSSGNMFHIRDMTVLPRN